LLEESQHQLDSAVQQALQDTSQREQEVVDQSRQLVAEHQQIEAERA
jgi:hypothetical protein